MQCITVDQRFTNELPLMACPPVQVLLGDRSVAEVVANFVKPETSVSWARDRSQPRPVHKALPKTAPC